jgi:hypothetical protein
LPNLVIISESSLSLRYDFYEKAVTFRPYQVDMLDPVTANFLGDNLRCWMQIQVGKGPHANEVSGIVKIGQTMTMVLGVKDDENKFDMMVSTLVNGKICRESDYAKMLCQIWHCVGRSNINAYEPITAIYSSSWCNK